MVPNRFLDHFQPFFGKKKTLFQKKVLLYWLQVSLQPEGSGVPSLMGADKPCPQLHPSLLWKA